MGDLLHCLRHTAIVRAIRSFRCFSTVICLHNRAKIVADITRPKWNKIVVTELLMMDWRLPQGFKIFECNLPDFESSGRRAQGVTSRSSMDGGRRFGSMRIAIDELLARLGRRTGQKPSWSRVRVVPGNRACISGLNGGAATVLAEIPIVYWVRWRGDVWYSKGRPELERILSLWRQSNPLSGT